MNLVRLGNIYRISQRIYAMPVGYFSLLPFFNDSALIYRVYSYTEFLDYQITTYAHYSCAVFVNDTGIKLTNEQVMERFKNGHITGFETYNAAPFAEYIGHMEVTDEYIIKTLLSVPPNERAVVKSKEQMLKEADELCIEKYDFYHNTRNQITYSTEELLMKYLCNKDLRATNTYVFQSKNEFVLATQGRDEKYYVLKSNIKSIKTLIPYIQELRRNMVAYMEATQSATEVFNPDIRCKIYPVSV